MMMNELDAQDRLVPRRKAAEMLGVAAQTMAKWSMTDQHLTTLRIGRNCYYRLSDLARLVSGGDGAPAAPPGRKPMLPGPAQAA
jgi:hypothetical protein